MARPTSASRTPSLALLALLGLAVRVAFLLLEPSTHPVGDERTWTDWALNLASPRVRFSPLRTHMIFYPPVYSYFLGALYSLTGGFEAAKWAQAGLSALLVPAVGRVAARGFSPGAGLRAAAITAFYPELVWFSVHFWSETVFLVLLWWGVERLLAADDGAGKGAAVAAGALWGLATLTRETVFYFLPFAALWLAWRRAGPGRTRAAAFLLAAVVVIAPWTWRNWLAFHAFVPVSTAGGQNLFQGNAKIPRDETYVMVDAVPGRVEQYRYAMRMGLQAIRDRQPGWILEKLRDEMPQFWEADSLVLIHLKRGEKGYGIVPPAAAVALAVVVLAPYLAVLALFVLGLALLVPTRARVLLLLFLAYYNAIHVVTHGFARYRLPVMPVVFVFAAAAWIALREGGPARLEGRRRVIAAALGLAFVVTLVPSLRLNLENPVYGLGDTGEAAPGEAAPPP